MPAQHHIIFRGEIVRAVISTVILLALTLIALVVSLARDRRKTVQSLGMAKGMFLNLAGEITVILALVGLLLTLVPASTIKSLLGQPSAWLSALWGALIGAITLLPAFVAFPLASSLVEKGAHLVAVAAFITSLTMVGLVTLPIEIKHFGRKFAFVRNALSLGFALLIAMGVAILI
jgi:uncharacterized membrane protein YraQ (UPF0718 family)